jgi:hypothetical protein
VTSFQVVLAELDQGASQLGGLAAKTHDLAVEVEGECEAPPKVGDVQATAVYQQAHYDWTQTRFEDLMASEAHLGVLSQKLHAVASNYAETEAQTKQALSTILDDLDTTKDGTGH